MSKQQAAAMAEISKQMAETQKALQTLKDNPPQAIHHHHGGGCFATNTLVRYVIRQNILLPTLL